MHFFYSLTHQISCAPELCLIQRSHNSLLPLTNVRKNSLYLLTKLSTLKTRMHYSRMLTVRCSGCHACAHCNACPPSNMPLCHAHPLPCMPPPPPCMPPAIHIPTTHAPPLPRMPPPLPRTPPSPYRHRILDTTL